MLGSDKHRRAKARSKEAFTVDGLKKMGCVYKLLWWLVLDQCPYIITFSSSPQSGAKCRWPPAGSEQHQPESWPDQSFIWTVDSECMSSFCLVGWIHFCKAHNAFHDVLRDGTWLITGKHRMHHASPSKHYHTSTHLIYFWGFSQLAISGARCKTTKSEGSLEQPWHKTWRNQKTMKNEVTHSKQTQNFQTAAFLSPLKRFTVCRGSVVALEGDLWSGVLRCQCANVVPMLFPSSSFALAIKKCYFAQHGLLPLMRCPSMLTAYELSSKRSGSFCG